MSNWLSRLFTVPRKTREQLAKVPNIDLLAHTVQSLAAAAATSVVDLHLPEGPQSEALKADIEAAVARAIPVPAPQSLGPQLTAADVHTAPTSPPEGARQ